MEKLAEKLAEKMGEDCRVVERSGRMLEWITTGTYEGVGVSDRRTVASVYMTDEFGLMLDGVLV